MLCFEGLRQSVNAPTVCRFAISQLGKEGWNLEMPAIHCATMITGRCHQKSFEHYLYNCRSMLYTISNQSAKLSTPLPILLSQTSPSTAYPVSTDPVLPAFPTSPSSCLPPSSQSLLNQSLRLLVFHLH